MHGNIFLTKGMLLIGDQSRGCARRVQNVFGTSEEACTILYFDMFF